MKLTRYEKDILVRILRIELVWAQLGNNTLKIKAVYRIARKNGVLLKLLSKI